MVLRGRGKYKRPSTDLPRHKPSSGRIGEYRALAGLPRSQDALNLLVKVGEAVAPLMARHGWHVPFLTEMRPKQHNLLGLNVNRGQKICLRLRPGAGPGKRIAGAPRDTPDPLPDGLDAFLEFESLVQTMLHELTHIVRGPHDQVFWSTLQSLSDEHDSLKRAGAAAVSFTEPGQRLGSGGRTMGAAPQPMARGNGVRLGGITGFSGPGRTPSSELAAAAALKRIQQAGSCPESVDVAREVELAAEQDEAKQGVETIVVSDTESEDEGEDTSDCTREHSSRPDSQASSTGSSHPSASTSRQRGSTSRRGATGCPTSSESAKPPTTTDEQDDSIVCIALGPSCRPKRPRRPRASSPTAIVLDDSSSSDEVVITGQHKSLRPTQPGRTPNAWSCPGCTLRNAPSALRCTACDAARPRWNVLGHSARQKLLNSSRGGLELATATIADPKAWQCTGCGWVMANEVAHRWMCTSCGQLRTSS